MHFTCQQADLASALETVLAAVDTKRKRHPILTCVSIRAADQEVALMTTDLSLVAHARISAQVETPGEAVVPCALLAEYVSTLTSGPMTMSTLEATPLLHFSPRYWSQPRPLFQIEQKRGTAASRMRLVRQAAGDFPHLPQVSPAAPAVRIASEQLIDALRKVAPFAEANASLYGALASILVESNPAAGELRLTATNKVSLAHAVLPLAPAKAPALCPPPCVLRGLLPASSAEKLCRLLPTHGTLDLQWEPTPGHRHTLALRLPTSSLSLYTSLWSEREEMGTMFPAYTHLLGIVPSLTLIVKRRDLQGALHSLKYLARADGLSTIELDIMPATLSLRLVDERSAEAKVVGEVRLAIDQVQAQSGLEGCAVRASLHNLAMIVETASRSPRLTLSVEKEQGIIMLASATDPGVVFLTKQRTPRLAVTEEQREAV